MISNDMISTDGQPVPQRNLALKKPASQSSIYSHSLKPRPALAVDGGRDTEFSQGTCIHTKLRSNDPQPWWKVDLIEQYEIDRVRNAF